MKTSSAKPNREFILETLDNAICTVTFNKLDGTQRTMKCTRHSGAIPKESQPKGTKTIKENTAVISAYDIEAEGWRSFIVENVTQFNFI